MVKRDKREEKRREEMQEGDMEANMLIVRGGKPRNRR